MRIDADFPGGNLIVERIEADHAFVRQDLRDTAGDWFYWYGRIREAAGRTVKLTFTGSNCIGVRGPAISADGGATWTWLGAEQVDFKAKSFSLRIPEGCDDFRASFGIPYLEANLRAFLARHAGAPALKVETLCVSEKGRTVEKLRAGRVDGEPRHRIFLACRHHCCEAIPDFALEGLIEGVLADDARGAYFREHVEFLIVPFVDKDGVEDGDQGKNRKPYDHNRDYGENCIYPSVGAIRELVPAWAGGKLRFGIDLHCPHIRGPHNEVLYFVGGPDEAAWARCLEFCALLESACRGPLPYFAKDNLPFGQGWNTTQAGVLKSCGRWLCEQPGILWGHTIEFPYANVSGAVVSVEGARAFGRDLLAAMERYLKEVVEAAG